MGKRTRRSARLSWVASEQVPGNGARPGNIGPVSASSLAARSPRQRFLTGTAIVALCTVALIVLLSAAGLAPWDRGAVTAAPHTVSVPLGGRQHAALAVLSGADSITLTAAPLPGQLVRVSTPGGAGSVPDVTVSGGTVDLSLRGAGSPGGPATVRVTLNAGVAWRLTLSGGASQTGVFLGGGRLRGADFTAGSSQITMRLPRPAGTVPIVLAGGASQVRVIVPAGVPARLRLDGGAATATLDGQARSGLAGGTVLTGSGWAAAADRYDIDAASGVSVISVGSG
jgi:hypothetical protein